MVKSLTPSLRGYRALTILTPLVMIGEAVMEIVIPFVMGDLINYLNDCLDGLDTMQMSQVLLFGGAMLLCAFFSLLCGVLGGKFASTASAGLAKNLRRDMYARIQTYSFANIDKFSTASLVTRLTTDVTNTQNAFQMCIRMLVRAPVLFIFATVMSYQIHVGLASMFIAAAIVLGIVVAIVLIKVVPYFRTMFKKYDSLNAVVQEDLTAIRVVKSYVRESYEIEKMKHATGEVYEYSVKAEKILNYLMPVIQVAINLTMVLLLFFGGRLIIAGNLQIGDLSKLLSYCAQILTGVIMVAMCLNFISMSRGSVERIAEVLDEKPSLSNPAEPVTEVKDGSVEFDHVDFAYRADAEKNVLSDITFSIRSGETVGIIGGTGSAKTTLVSLIPRLYDVKSGSIKVGGVDVRDYDMEALRNQVAVVLQKNVLFSGSISENLRWGNENATDEEIREAASLAQASEFIRDIPEGFDYDLGQGGVNVSGGQKQRLCIARALLKNPKILIFDDSTSAVDTKTDALIRAGLKKHAPEVTKIIIAQRIASVQESDRIIVMDEGRIVGIGTHEELLKTSDIYREVYESQVKGGDEDAQK